MAADRAEHVTLVLEPALAAGEWVVTDRYSASTIAYQGYGRGLDPAGLAELVAWATGGLGADLSILVDVSVEVAAARLAASGGRGADRMEQLGPEFASRVRQGFLDPGRRGPRALGRRRRQRRGRDADGAYRGLRARAAGRRAGRGPVSEERPAPELFAGVVGQEEAVAALRAAAVNPVHAYLFRGPAGNGGLVAAHGFAAALLCPDGGCGACATCRAALAGTDPDLHVIRRSGASISIGEIRQVVSLAQRRPLHAAAPGDRPARRAPRGAAGTCAVEDPRGAAGGHRLHPADRRGDPRAGDGGQPLGRDRVPAGAPSRSWCAGSPSRGCRPTPPPWWRTAAVATPNGPASRSTTRTWRRGSRCGHRCPTSWARRA